MAELTNPQNTPEPDGATLTIESNSDAGTLYSYSKTTPFTGTEAENAAEIMANGVGQAPVIGTNTRVVTGQDPITPHYAGWVQDSDDEPAPLADYFVDPVSGTLLGDGTAGNPIAFLSAAVARANTGEVVGIINTTASMPINEDVKLIPQAALTIEGNGGYMSSATPMGSDATTISPAAQTNGTTMESGSGASVVSDNSLYGGTKQCIKVGAGASNSHATWTLILPPNTRFRMRLCAKNVSGSIGVRVKHGGTGSYLVWGSDEDSADSVQWAGSGGIGDHQATNIVPGADEYNDWLSTWQRTPKAAGTNGSYVEIRIGAAEATALSYIQTLYFEIQSEFSEYAAVADTYMSPCGWHTKGMEGAWKSTSADIISMAAKASELQLAGSLATIQPGECWHTQNTHNTEDDNNKFFYRLDTGENIADLHFRAVSNDDTANGIILAAADNNDLTVNNLTTGCTLFGTYNNSSTGSITTSGFTALGAMRGASRNTGGVGSSTIHNGPGEFTSFSHDSNYGGAHSDTVLQYGPGTTEVNNTWVHAAADECAQIVPGFEGSVTGTLTLNNCLIGDGAGGEPGQDGYTTQIECNNAGLSVQSATLALNNCTIWRSPNDPGGVPFYVKTTYASTDVGVTVNNTVIVNDTSTSSLIYFIDSNINYSFAGNYNGGVSTRSDLAASSGDATSQDDYMANSTYMGTAILDEFVDSDPSKGVKPTSAMYGLAGYQPETT